jgi:hypothetical protein
VQVCVEANLYSSTVSQADADNQAYSVALDRAKSGLDCGLAGQLNGLRWEMPCTNGSNPCSCVNPADNSQVAQGNPGQTYTVQLRVRGLVECKPYGPYGVAGTGNQNVFTCTNPTQAIPAAGAHGDNEYALVISDPPATLFLNNSLTGIAPAAVSKLDYQLTIYVKTGAVVTAKARSVDNLQWRNPTNLIVNAAPPAIGVAEPYLNGEFIQIDVLSVL